MPTVPVGTVPTGYATATLGVENDGADINPRPIGILVLVAGTIVFDTDDATDLTTTSVAVGTIIPIRIKRLKVATGATVAFLY